MEEVKKTINEIVRHQNDISRLLQVLERQVTGTTSSTSTVATVGSSAGDEVTLLVIQGNSGGRDNFRALLDGLETWAKRMLEERSLRIRVNAPNAENVPFNLPPKTIVVPVALSITSRFEDDKYDRMVKYLVASEIPYWPVILRFGSKADVAPHEVMLDNNKKLTIKTTVAYEYPAGVVFSHEGTEASFELLRRIVESVL